MKPSAATKRIGVTPLIVAAAALLLAVSASRPAVPAEDGAACEHVHVAADAFDRDDHARMMDSMRRAHESASSQHLHWRTKMVLKVFNATGEIYEQGLSDVRHHCNA